MKTWAWSLKILTIVFAVVLLGGCATPYYGNYYTVQQPAPAAPNQAPAIDEAAFLTVGPQDRYYIMHVDNRTPFPAHFPQAHKVLYEKGYDQVRRGKGSRFFSQYSTGLLKLATTRTQGHNTCWAGRCSAQRVGTLIGAAAHAPVTGAIAGAAGGGVLWGWPAPADLPMIRIDVQVQDFRDRTSSGPERRGGHGQCPPLSTLPRVIDIQVSKMLAGASIEVETYHSQTLDLYTF